MSRTAVACVAALSLAACAPTLTRHLPPQDDPSNPDAPESAWHPPPSSQASERAAPSPATAAAAYTCPMHPEVISDRPGRCPKCGMALAQKKEQP